MNQNRRESDKRRRGVPDQHFITNWLSTVRDADSEEKRNDVTLMQNVLAFATAGETERARSEVDIHLANDHPVQTSSVHCADMMHAMEKASCGGLRKKNHHHPSFVDIRNIVSGYKCLRETAHKKQKVLLILIAHTKTPPRQTSRESSSSSSLINCVQLFTFYS